MAQCFEWISDQLQPVATAAQDCAGFLLLDATEYVQLSTMGQITPEDIAYVWAWGFGSVLTPWAIAYGIMWAKKTINQL